MSDGSLSQDEIDALLQGTDTIEMDTSGAAGASPMSDAERNALQEMLRGVTESQGSNLSILTGQDRDHSGIRASRSVPCPRCSEASRKTSWTCAWT